MHARLEEIDTVIQGFFDGVELKSKQIFMKKQRIHRAETNITPASIPAAEGCQNIAHQGVSYTTVMKSEPQRQENTSAQIHNLIGLFTDSSDQPVYGLDTKQDARNDALSDQVLTGPSEKQMNQFKIYHWNANSISQH